ncbi:hypothetical protein D3C74_474560 [compost metagenome]
MPKIDIADVKTFVIEPRQIVITFPDNLLCPLTCGQKSFRFCRMGSRVQWRFPLQYFAELFILQTQPLVGFH